MTTETLQNGIPDPTFEELLLLARQGSKDALGRVLESCRRVLLRAARRQIPSDVQSKGTASDVVQDTFLEAQRDFPQFTGSTRAEFVAWLSRILENNSTNLVHAYRNRRKREVAREVSLDDPGVAPRLAHVQAPERNPPVVAIAHEEAEILLAAIDHLPEQCQAVLRCALKSA